MNIPLKELKENLSHWTEEASKGSQILVTKYNRPYIMLLPGGGGSLYHGSRVGKASLTSELDQASKGRYLDYLLHDREEANDD